jgi:predicted permease
VIASILFDILGPILVLVLLGAWARWRFKIDVGSLSKLNIYLFVPAFFFEHVVNSRLALGQALGVVLATVAQVTILGLLVWGIGRMLGANRKTLAAIAMCAMFYNSGNYGLPLSELAYPAEGEGGTSAGVAEYRGNRVEERNATAPLRHSDTPTPPKNGRPSRRSSSSAKTF